jgi:ABC-type glycerol-3-phosphate transport system substrate-binding protein
MKTIPTPTALAALAAALTLAGCGGSSHYDAPTTPTTPTTPPISMTDAFFTAVMGIIDDGSETTTEPVAVDSIAATAPEDTEPATLK